MQQVVHGSMHQQVVHQQVVHGAGEQGVGGGGGAALLRPGSGPLDPEPHGPGRPRPAADGQAPPMVREQ